MPVHHSRTAITRAAVLAAALALTTTTLLPAAAAPPVETKVAELTNPAIQAVLTEYSAKASIGQVTFTNDGWRLLDQGIKKVGDGELTSARAVAGWMFDHISENPGRYYKTTGKARTVKMSDSYVGSSFLAGPTGYAITARHVVTPDGEVRSSFLEEGSAALGKSAGDAMVRIFRKWDLSSETKKDIRASVTAFVKTKLKLSISSPKVSLLMGVTGPSGSRIGQAQPAEVVYRSGAALGEDVAVLRTRGAENLPTLALAAEPPGQGSQIYVNCFPADATWNSDMSEAAQLQPTLSSGQITAIKPSTGGINLLQTNAVVSGGCSGGPALNAAGEVVGIVVSGVSGGQNYLQPVGLLSEALQRSAADLRPSLTSAQWAKALADYHQDYYSRAMAEFKDVQALYPPHAYVGKFIADSQTAITQGRDQTPVESKVSPILIGSGIGGGVLLVGGATVAALLIVRRRRTHAAAAVAPAAPAEGAWAPLPSSSGNEAAADWPDEAGAPADRVGDDALPNHADGSDLPPDADAPDSFPSWKPIDFVPAYPPVEAEPGKAG